MTQENETPTWLFTRIRNSRWYPRRPVFQTDLSAMRNLHQPTPTRMQFQLWQILVLAVVQGVTEFLPVSSSGHLVIVAGLLAPGGSTKDLDIADVNIVLHLGTLVSILVFYWQRIWKLLNEDRRAVGLLIVASLPAAIIGIPIKLWFSQILESPYIAGALLPMTGVILLWAARCKPGDQTYQTMSYGQAFTIGLSQAVAIMPGISRSGTTISTGLRLGLSPQSAATFSFMMAIVAIGGAGLLEVISAFRHPIQGSPLSHLIAGAVVSCVVGLGSLWVLVRWLERGRFQAFAYWCIFAGVGILIWLSTTSTGKIETEKTVPQAAIPRLQLSPNS